MKSKFSLANGTTSTMKKVLTVAGLTCLVLSYQNCGNVESQSSVMNEATSTNNNQSYNRPVNSKLDCQFTGVNVLKERMKSLLQIAKGDVPVLNANGTASANMRLAMNAASLGQGDSTKGIFDDLSCGTTKFKSATEIMVDACTLSLQNAAMKQKLFPKGAEDFDVLYTAFMGRLPTLAEKTILLELVSTTATAKKEAAACAAVASSLESLIRI